MTLSGAKQKIFLDDRPINIKNNELILPVAPACNLMCNFCSKDSDCVCNGNSPSVLSKSMTPRQAVNWAAATVKKNRRIRVIKITGPGEPLFNNQTFEVLKRLNTELSGYEYSVSTNGFLLSEKVEDLVKLNVSTVEVSINAVSPYIVRKLCSRAIYGSVVIINSDEMAQRLIRSQIEGLKKCMDYGITVKVNSIYFPGVNDDDLVLVAHKLRILGIKSIRIISCDPKGKFSRMRKPDIKDLVSIQQKLLSIMDEIEVENFVSA